jgi:glycine/D-amino acid oxidase-like deaminating enzyme
VLVETAIWLDQLNARERAELVRGAGVIPEPRPDLLIVGGGIAGVATAAACHQAGLGSVLLIEAGHLGAGATGGAAGLLTPEIHEWSDPEPFVDLARASLGQWAELEETSPGAVVFATGLPPVLDGLDIDVPWERVKGHLLVTEPTPLRLPGIVAPVATQLEDRRLLVGGTFDMGDESPVVRQEIIDSILAGLYATLPQLRGLRADYTWCCFRPRHPDGLPVIDRIHGLGNAWLTSGHYRTGILLAPVTAQALVRWISSDQPPAEAAAWSSERFAGRGLSGR